MEQPHYRDLSPETVAASLADGAEIAFIDVREEGQHGEGHPLLSINIPYSRLELDVGRLVPRLSCRIVLVDDDDGTAPKAAARLDEIGYRDIGVLSGGAHAWQKSGRGLYESLNVPSKAFAELIEHQCATPAVTAAELETLKREGADIAILDSRTIEEYGRFHVPGAVSCPGAELVHRFADLVPSPETFVVVSCAGRTRGIIGAQALINAGVPNRVASLSGGTQGWLLGGYDLERGVPATSRPLTSEARAAAIARAAEVARRFGVKQVGRDTLDGWRAERETRSLYLLDVRTPAEFMAGHLPGAVSAQGGQLVQAIDKWVGARGARIVLVDDTGTRAIMTAHWLQQMGWDVSVMEGGIEAAGAALESGAADDKAAANSVAGSMLTPAQARDWMSQGAASISVEPSADFRKAHAPGACWSIRPRLDRLPSRILAAPRILIFGDDPRLAELAAKDLAVLSQAEIAIVEGGTRAWSAAGLPVESSPGTPPDSERIDYLFWNHDRHEGNQNAMRGYLQWELDLPPRIAVEANAGIRIAAANVAQTHA